MAVYIIAIKVVILVLVGFFDPLPITVTSDLLVVTGLIPEISGTDSDMFILAKGSYFLRSIPVLNGNPTLSLNLFISLPHSHLASSSILSTSVIFTLSN